MGLDLQAACLCDRSLSAPHTPRAEWGFLMAVRSDEKYMQRALQLAAIGVGRTSPNPAVGAVLVKSGRVIGEGYHAGPGKNHAEIEAIKQAKGRAKGATLYVTLEPCCHQGRTAPCTEAIIAAGIKRVIAAVKDPNPIVNGRGVRTLRRKGVEVTLGLSGKEARALNEPYFFYHEKQRPLVIVKSAHSLDGRIATKTGDSKWITSKEARRYAHQLRAEVDAVIVGAETVRTDDPKLTVRHVKGKQPYRIVVTSSGKLPANCHLLQDNENKQTIVATTEQGIKRLNRVLKNSDTTVWLVKERRGRIDLNSLLQAAYRFGFQSLLVEGGAALATSFWKARLVDIYLSIMAPIVIGDGVDAIGDLGIKSVQEALRFKDTELNMLGDDLLFVGRPHWKDR